MTCSIQELLLWTGGRLVNASELGDRVDTLKLSRPVSLAGAKQDEIAFFFSRAFEHELPGTDPGVLITGEPFVQPLKHSGLPLWRNSAIIACQDPYSAMALVTEKFATELSTGSHLPKVHAEARFGVAVHPSSVIHPTAQLGEGVQIGPGCTIDAHVQIGNGSVLYPGCVIGPHSTLGAHCTLFPNVVLYEGTQLGARVRIHAGAVIGADGFGYAPKRQAGQVIGHQKIYHFGNVVLGDDVEIGANTCIDRGTFNDTQIGKNVKIDNLVQIGHNARIDEGSVICGGACIAGNAHVGKFVYMGGISGINNHVHVGDGARIGACSSITKDIPPGGTGVGIPQRTHAEHFRLHAFLNRLQGKRGKKSRSDQLNSENKSEK